MALYLALSCLQGRPMSSAYRTLLALEPDGVQLTGGNLPCPEFRVLVEAGPPHRTHHGFCFDARRARVWSDAHCLVESESVHPPKSPSATWIAKFDAGAQGWPALETMYPGYALGSASSIRRAMEIGLPLAVDISHLYIQKTQGDWCEVTWRRLQDYDRILEVHVSANQGAHDSHHPLSPTTFGLGWAQERLRAQTPVILECYMHRMSDQARRAQLDLIRGSS